MKVTYVKAARVAIPSAGIAVGEPYYWWKFMRGSKQVSKTRPLPSQLTRSEFWGSVYEMQERSEPEDLDSLESAIEDLKSDLESLRDDTQEKFDNMPESLQGGDTGQLLESRINSVEEAISEIEGITIPTREDIESELDLELKPPVDGESDEEKEAREEENEEAIEKLEQEAAAEAWQEAMDALGSIND